MDAKRGLQIRMRTNTDAMDGQSPHVPHVKQAKRASSCSGTIVTLVFSEKGLSFYHSRHGVEDSRLTVHMIDEALPLNVEFFFFYTALNYMVTVMTRVHVTSSNTRAGGCPKPIGRSSRYLQ